MKKLLFLVLLTSMFGTAHATRSRMNSLGQDANQGSFYLMDNRDFFRNPANASKMRNFMVAELANGDASGIGDNVEGGYFGEFSSDMAFGVYLGKQNVLSDTYAAAISTATGAGLDFQTANESNPVNLFLAGGSDMKWGLNVNFGMSKNEGAAGAEQKYSSIGAGLGIETSGGLQDYINYPIQEEAKGSSSTSSTTNGNKLETTGLQFGIIYALNAETTIFGQYGQAKTEITTTTTTKEAESTSFIIGVGRIYELSPTARFNFDLSYRSDESEVKGTTFKISDDSLPLTIGLEADAAEWLILRASVQQNFFLGETETSGVSTSQPFSTKVALGGTLHFGKLKIDGNLGGVGSRSDTSLLNTSDFFVQAAATYMF